MATNLGVPVVNSGKYYFISYNTEDADIVSRYLKSMVDKGLPVWYDYGIPQGEEWEMIIAEKIYNCEAVIMFFSANILKKEESYVRIEWDIAKRRKKKVYIVMLDEINENDIPARYAFWWSKVIKTQIISAYILDTVTCAKKVVDAIKADEEKKKYANKFPIKDSLPANVNENSPVLFDQARDEEIVQPDIQVNNDDFEIESGVLKKYKGKGGIVRIPDSVTAIGDYAFAWCSNLTSVVIPDSVTTIGDDAFWCCRSLTSVVISDSVTTIGNSVFYSCDSLSSVVIGDSVTTIGFGVFSDCRSLKYNTYDNARYLGNDNNPYLALVKAKKSTITSCIIHKDTRFICSIAFSKCSSLAEIVIPNSVTSIGNSAFRNCRSLTSIVIPNSMTTIGNNAFYGCSSLASVVIPSSVTEISAGTFSGCKKLESIQFLGSKSQWAEINKSKRWIPSYCKVHFNK